MARVVHFEIAAKNADRAQKFWSNVFDWKLQKWEGEHEYWMITTGDGDDMGINGGMMLKNDAPQDAGSTVIVLGVESIDDTTKRVEEEGGAQITPKMAVGTMGWTAYCKDTEGTVFCLWQTNPEGNN
jgi:predicted enzyme related to lactoylglutathione lyase